MNMLHLGEFYIPEYIPLMVSYLKKKNQKLKLKLWSNALEIINSKSRVQTWL